MKTELSDLTIFGPPRFLSGPLWGNKDICYPSTAGSESDHENANIANANTSLFDGRHPF